MKTNKRTRIKIGRRVAGLLSIFIIVAVVVYGSNYKNDAEVKAISQACANSADCMAAVKAEEEANANAAAAQDASNRYQNKVNELNAQIASTERVIADTKAQIKELNKQIEETEEKLNDEQEALAELLINMHFEGDSEPITILAGSSSISDLAEKQARAEVVKQQISATAVKIKEAKEQLEADKAEVEQLLESQKQLKEDLATSKAEQQELVTKYANDAAAYEEAAKAAIEAQREAELAEIAAHPDLYQGSSFSGYNNYEWQDKCPQENAWYITYLNGYPIGGAVCQCTSYAGWKVWKRFGYSIAWGDASSWDDYAWADSRVTRVDNNPEPDSVGQADGGYYGHVWWVESINADGSVNITEYNNPYATCLYQTGGDQYYCGYHYDEYPSGDFGSRTMSAAVAAQYTYIHFK